MSQVSVEELQQRAAAFRRGEKPSPEPTRSVSAAPTMKGSGWMRPLVSFLAIAVLRS